MRRPPGGPAKGDRRRQAIVAAVEHLLHERTIADLSVENIAAAAGISRSGFYFYFENKYAALGDALQDAADEMTRAADDFFTGSDGPAEYFAREVADVASLWRRHTDLMVAIVDAAHSDQGARTLWEAWLERFITAISERIETDRASGKAPPGPPAPRDLARILMLMNQAVFDDLARRRAGDEERDRTVGALNRVWLASVWGITGR
jgi:AcrR family transcriptional regulator